MGSICEAIGAVTIQFDAVSAISGSPLTPDMTGSLEINSKLMFCILQLGKNEEKEKHKPRATSSYLPDIRLV